MSKEGGPIMMICTRLKDQTVMHPDQTQELCSQCQHMVSVYPTGQRAIKNYPDMKIICTVCAKDALEPGDVVAPAGSLKEFIQEARSSVPVGKA
jgi:hypothetical protein